MIVYEMIIILTLVCVLDARTSFFTTALSSSFLDVLTYILLGLTWHRLTATHEYLELRDATWAPWVKLLSRPDVWIVEQLHLQHERDEIEQRGV